MSILAKKQEDADTGEVIYRWDAINAVGGAVNGAAAQKILMRRPSAKKEPVYLLIRTCEGDTRIDISAYRSKEDAYFQMMEEVESASTECCDDTCFQEDHAHCVDSEGILMYWNIQELPDIEF